MGRRDLWAKAHVADLGRRYPLYVISVVVPLLNEEHSLDELYREIVAALDDGLELDA